MKAQNVIDSISEFHTSCVIYRHGDNQIVMETYILNDVGVTDFVCTRFGKVPHLDRTKKFKNMSEAVKYVV